MSGIFGLLDLDATDRSFVNSIGQGVVFDAVNELVNRYNRDLQAAMAVFVEDETELHQERYYLPGGGRLPRLGRQVPGPASRATGSWTVGYPLEGFGAQVAGDRVTMAYMNMQQLDRHMDTIFLRDTNTVRWEILHALLDDGGGSGTTFDDPQYGDVTVHPLANGDAVTYPPVLGSESEATEDHYAESGYAATAISDSNNPYITGRDELEEHFGTMTGGNNIVAFINNAETPETEDLTDFIPVEDRFIRSGDDTDIPENLPMVPGRVIGRTNGVWVSEWRWIPANYMLFIHLDAPAPLKMRVDESGTGLPRGLTLISEEDKYPLEQSHWEHRFGIGAANRLNGFVMELGTGGTYTVPTAYD